MAIGDLNPASWRIDVYKMKPERKNGGYISDLSNFYTSDLAITRQRNYPDEIRFTLDLQQLEERAKLLNIASRELLEPYVHKVKIYRNNKFMAQAIVVKVDVNLNNESKNTVEVSCVDILGLLEKRLIHQDYGEGSWADFARQVVMDAQHEPSRVYNYAFEGDGTAIDNAWFRGWTFTPGASAKDLFPDWEPNKLYSMYDRCNHGGKFWEAKEHAFYSGETFTESNWTLLGILDPETGETAAAYAIWREDDEEPGPTGTNLGGWGGTSSCHMSGSTLRINNAGDITSIELAGSETTTSLVAPLYRTASPLPDGYTEVEYLDLDGMQDFFVPLTVTQNTTIEVDMKINGFASGNISTVLFSSRDSTTDQWISVGCIGPDPEEPLPTSFVAMEYLNGTTYTAGFPEIFDRHVYKLRANKVFVDGKTMLRAEYLTPDGTPDKYTMDDSVHLASDYLGGARSVAYFYGATVLEKDQLVKRLIPCIRNSDEAVGLYDTVSATFIESDTEAPTAGPIVDTEKQYTNKQFYSRVMAKNAGDATSKIQLIVESYGGSIRQLSPEFTIIGNEWNKIEYLWPAQDFDVYRFGFKIVSGDMLVDSPVIYWQPIEGDEWDLGIRIGEFPSDEEQEKAGWLKNRHTPIYEWKNAKETLLDLSNMDSDNFWYAIDENYRFNLWVNQGSDRINVALSYPKNITTMSVATNANDVFNYIKGDGSAEVSQDPLVSGVYNDNSAPFTWIEKDEASMQKYWALAEAVGYNSERTFGALKNDLLAELSSASNMQDVPNIKIKNNAVTPDQIGLGDIVSVEAHDIPYVHRINGLYKIVAYNIEVDIDGNESISLTLLNPTENQINSLSFPQLIKNLINRLHGTR